MTYKMLRLALGLSAIVLCGAAPTPSGAEEDSAALAAAMKDATITLQTGLKASEREGTPISAKFEIEDGKLQLSVYTMKGEGFMEVVADPKTGAIDKAEKISDADDLKAATSQKVKVNTGSRAVSVDPQLQNGRALAEVTLLQGTAFKKVTEKLD